MDLRHLIFSILFYLSAGTFLSFAVLRPSQVTRKFYIIHGLLASFLAVASYAFVLGKSPSLPFTYAFLGFVGFSTLFYFFTERSTLLSTLSFAVGACYALLAIYLDTKSQVPVASVGIVANSILSALLLGVTMSAMLLGHWYLNQPKMSTGELKKLTLLFMGLVAIRFLFASVQLMPLLSGKNEMEIYRFFLNETKGIFVLMRYAWGILGPLALCYFIWGTVKIRSTQSATGILYVAVVFVLIGEIISQYLSYFHGVAL